MENNSNDSIMENDNTGPAMDSINDDPVMQKNADTEATEVELAKDLGSLSLQEAKYKMGRFPNLEVLDAEITESLSSLSFEDIDYDGAVVLVTTQKLNDFLFDLGRIRLANPLAFFVKLEGTYYMDKAESCKVSFISFFVAPMGKVYIFDSMKATKKGFSHTHPANNLSVKMIVESRNIPKVFFKAEK